MKKNLTSAAILAAAALAAAFAFAEASPTPPTPPPPSPAAHSFAIGESDFLLDGKPFTIRCGEVHYARIPRPYWRHRLKMLRAMGCNAVGCYMFWNFHERESGKFEWSGEADAPAFCRMAQEEGLWVILRPGPYACAEWECGGAPWWLMSGDTKGGAKGISMRSSDPRWLEPAKRWITEVGRVLAPLQATRGGPILMVQVENEYGLHGSDVAYIKALREATLAAGFEVPLYACNPPRVIQNGFVPELFQAANFGGDPEQRFGIIRRWQPKGPLMCSEYYPAWFDTWGQPHHPPKRDRDFFGPIDWMLERRASFSLYMAHGGTSFGLWTGCRNPFVPNVTSYDYEAPISEQGRPNPTFPKFRDRCAKHLNPGESIPDMPDPIPVKAYGSVAATRFASLDALVRGETSLERPVYMEELGQGFGLVSYERMLSPSDSGLLSVENVHDFGYVFVDGRPAGILDRRHRGVKAKIEPAADGRPRLLQILLEPMGRINSSSGMEDRKGLSGRVLLGRTELKGGWSARLMPIDPSFSPDLPKPSHASPPPAGGLPALYSATLRVDGGAPADSWLDMSAWSKGMVWVNGRNLGRFWSIGPQQTLFVPGCWLRPGDNEITVLDFFGPRSGASLVFTDRPVLDRLDLESDFNRVSRPLKSFPGGTEAASGSFPSSDSPQVVMLPAPVRGETFTLQALSVHDRKSLAAIAEFDFLDAQGNPMTSLDIEICGVDSEEEVREDGTGENAVDGQMQTVWLSSSRSLPHWISFRVPAKAEIHGFRCTPRQGGDSGRIKDWKFFVR